MTKRRKTRGGTSAWRKLQSSLSASTRASAPSMPTATSIWKSERGTIHGIVGENGAGKSTLMSILYGFYQADSGEIRVGGKPMRRSTTPNDAIAVGIGMVHQHFMLVENFTVIENVILGAEGEPLLKTVHRQGALGARAAGARIRAGSRSRRGHRGAAGRPAAARRDPQGALSRRRHPDPRRADRRADAGRGRPSVPHPQAAQGRRARRSS